MSNSDYREINNALNNYYGNKMDLYEVGTEYREEYRQKMNEQKKLVKELSLKAEAFDDIEERFNSYKTGVKEDYEKDMTGTNLHLLLVGAAVKNHFDEFYVDNDMEVK